MEKLTKVVRLITAVLLGIEAGLRVAKQARELAPGEHEVPMPDLATAMNSVQDKLRRMAREAAEQAGRHNDAPGSD